MEKQNKIKRWLGIISLGLFLGAAITIACDRAYEWLYARKHQKIPISEAIGVYSWDLSVFHPPGSQEAKRIVSGLKGIYTDRPIYLRFLGPKESGENIMVWDFEMSPEQLKQWQKQLRANQASEAIGVPGAPQPQR